MGTLIVFHVLFCKQSYWNIFLKGEKTFLLVVKSFKGKPIMFITRDIRLCFGNGMDIKSIKVYTGDGISGDKNTFTKNTKWRICSLLAILFTLVISLTRTSHFGTVVFPLAPLSYMCTIPTEKYWTSINSWIIHNYIFVLWSIGGTQCF